MSDRALRRMGVVALIVLLLLIASLGRLLAIDQRVWLLVLLARGCTTDLTVDQMVHGAVLAMGLLVVVVALLHLRRRGPAATWPVVVVLAVGAMANDVLKQTLTRERPSNLPGVVDGHGFPSGHVMNTALAAGVVYLLAGSLRRPLPWRLAALALTATVASGRVLAGDHWVLDVVGALLTAVALLGLAVPAFRRRPLVAPLALAAALAGVLALHTIRPEVALRLPSPLTVVGDDIVEVRLAEIGPEVSLGPGWRGGGREDPAGSIMWLDGAAAATVFAATWLGPVDDAEAAAGTDGDTPPAAPKAPPVGPGELLVMEARPDKAAACTVARVAVNGNLVTTFVPFRGWRQYRIPLPEGTYRPGYDELQVAARAPDGAPLRLAVSRFLIRWH
jgi:undecaprenyl-diphosphatase